jgi:ABC-2 type transport system ATP-binding protein
MVLGNKSQMLWDIPPLETFRVLAEIYHVPRTEYQKTLDELVSLLDMGSLLQRPVRTFSLGERMKCELVAGLIFRPSVLFLDEPTLGLDTLIQVRLREFICEYNRLHGATIMLTSHYMADVVALCQRVILIHNGQLLFSGLLNQLAEKLAPYKLVRVALAETDSKLDGLPGQVEILEKGDGHLTLRVAREDAPALTSYLLNNFPITDLAVEDPPIEAVIDRVYREESV